MKWNIGKKGGATYFFARAEGGSTEFSQSLKGGHSFFRGKFDEILRPPPPPTHI